MHKNKQQNKEQYAFNNCLSYRLPGFRVRQLYGGIPAMFSNPTHFK
jgi:hypothetical protein